jgi:hypothetical protein
MAASRLRGDVSAPFALPSGQVARNRTERRALRTRHSMRRTHQCRGGGVVSQPVVVSLTASSEFLFVPSDSSRISRSSSHR